MQRSDKEMTQRSDIDEIIRKCLFCHLAFAVESKPYTIPVCYGYDGSCLYIHTAKAGQKIDFIRANPQVCFAMEHKIELVDHTAKPCAWTFAFESVIGFGRIEELTEPQSKASGLNRIVSHYAKNHHRLEPIPPAELRVWRIHIDSVTGKCSGPGRHNL